MRPRLTQIETASEQGGLSRIRSRGRKIFVQLGMLILAVCAAFFPGAVTAAGPLDLADLTPRWVDVRFEVSPANLPGQLDSEWSHSRAAFVDPTAGPGIVEIRIPAEEMEEHLRSTGTDAVSGSFSEFVWIFDRETGHVLTAEMQGRVRERVRFGFIQTSTTIDIKVEMTTQQVAGFVSESGMLGIETQRFCAPGPIEAGLKVKRSHMIEGCIGVVAAPLDRARGYVNAVGMVRAATPIVEIEAFSPLGEVRFSERGSVPNPVVPASYLPADVASDVASGVSTTDAVCSSGFSGRCLVDDLGGES